MLLILTLFMFLVFKVQDWRCASKLAVFSQSWGFGLRCWLNFLVLPIFPGISFMLGGHWRKTYMDHMWLDFLRGEETRDCHSVLGCHPSRVSEFLQENSLENESTVSWITYILGTQYPKVYQPFSCWWRNRKQCQLTFRFLNVLEHSSCALLF